MASHDSQRWKMLYTAVAASFVTFSAMTAYQAMSRRRKRRELDREVIRSTARADNLHHVPMPDAHWGRDSATFVPVKLPEAYDEGLIREQLARNYAFFGDDAMARVRRSRVVVVGCGGVGSYAAMMLARSGVSKIRLVDFDYVTLSSLNRHATALLADVGTPKVNCVRRTIGEFARWVEVDARIDIWRKDEGGAQLLEGADWVVDAIDNIATKVDLLKYCYDNKIKVFSAMGAGAKSDPTHVQISDISYTLYDPLARSVRRRLRALGVSSGIPVVYSTETPSDVKLLPLSEEEFKKGKVNELGVFDDFRVRILPVIGPLPSIFGLHIATYILCDLAGKPILNPLPVKNRYKTYDRLLRDLTANEAKLTGKNGFQSKLPLDEDEIAFIYEDLHRGGRSILPPHSVPTRSTLTRWDFREPLSLENCVVMELKDAEKHWGAMREGNMDPEVLWGGEVAREIQKRRAEAREWREWVMQ
ncbi:hypothetical protein BU17DRAFT_74648 [Hysterangium stoloniferum]|nr:hypothetical protein BU17DRAFT_74648 [Hysterangium stoloniferum]